MLNNFFTMVNVLALVIIGNSESKTHYKAVVNKLNYVLKTILDKHPVSSLI